MKFSNTDDRTIFPLILALLLPLVMLAAHGQWAFDSTHFFDTNVYLGFFKRYLEFKMPYAANYKSSRLPFLFPAVLAYWLLPAVVAHHALFLGPRAVKTALLYAIVRRRYGVGLAFVVAVADAVFIIPHGLGSYHDEMASMYFIAALATILLPTDWRVEIRAALAGFFLATAVTTDVLVCGVVPLVGLHLLAAERRPFRVRRLAVIAALMVSGAVAALTLFGLLNRLVGGPFLFFLDQVQMSLHLAKAQQLSAVKLSDFLGQIWSFPWLVLPVVVAVASLVLLASVLARRVRDGRFPSDAAPSAIDAVGVVGSLAAAVWMQCHGLGVLEHPHLFHPFYVPVFLAIPVLLGGHRFVKVRLDWRDMLVVALVAIGPLVLLGAPLSRLLLRAGTAWAPATFGVPFAFAGLLLAAAVAFLGRWRPRMMILAGAFGLSAVNVFCVTPWQPTYLYQLGDRCSFRSDAFAAIMAAEEAIATFDPDGEARWASREAPEEYPAFDGQGWCTALPLHTVARAALLTHYFYTSDEFVHGVRVRPLKKVTLAGTSPAEIDALEADAKTGVPPGARMERVLDLPILRGTVALYLRGYDIMFTN